MRITEVKCQAVLTGAVIVLAFAAMPQIAPSPASVRAAQEDVPEVAEALHNLEKSLTRHGSYAANGFIRRFDAKDFRGCKITYELTPQTPPDHTGFVPFTERTTVNLSSLDAGSVRVREGRRGATVSFAAREAAPVIERRLGDGPHSFGGATRLSSASVYVPNKVAAEEVRAALVRAIESCVKQG